jgi:hypothetical protein
MYLVLHFEGQRARRLDIDDLSVRAHQASYVFADQRVVIGRSYAAAGQHLLTKVARRSVGRIDHQQMVAAFETGLQRSGDRSEARRHQHRPVSALDRRQGLFQRESGRCAEQTVAHHVEPRLGVAFGLPFGHVG